MTTIYYDDDQDCYYISVGEGRIARACGECRHRMTECLCRKAREEEYAKKRVEQNQKRAEFEATLPRRVPVAELAELSKACVFTPCSKAANGTGQVDMKGYAGVYVYKDNVGGIKHRRYKE